MSHEKIKSIAINEKTGKIFITSASNNCIPITYNRYECTYLEDILKDKGRVAVDEYILDQYQGGMMQGGSNEYTQCSAIYGAYNLESLDRLRSLKKSSKGKKFIITYGSNFLCRIIRSKASIVSDKKNAQQFNQIDALMKANRFNDVQVMPA